MPDSQNQPAACPAFPFVRQWQTGPNPAAPTPPGRHDEWLLTSGQGGFAMGTPENTPRRKYHAYLVGTTNPPVDRVALLNSVEVGVNTDSHPIRWCDASSLRRFEHTADAVTWHHELGSVRITIRLRLARHRSACRLDIHTSPSTTIALRPWLTLRDFHEVLSEQEQTELAAESAPRRDAAIVRRSNSLACWLCVPGSVFTAQPGWSAVQHYDLETERGLPDRERWFSPGVFTLTSPAGEAQLHAGLGDAVDLLRDTAIEQEAARLGSLVDTASQHNAALKPAEALVVAADRFIVERWVDNEPLASVIAGYPWFADWGRDTMIALPGLLLTTGRHAEAFSCLETFARYESEGMIPNRFDDYGGPPHYNTVDASLWFIHACRAYALATGNLAQVRAALLPACRAIIKHYQVGTRYNIAADPADQLITAGDETTQLTWMDAKRDNVVFTPRHGKAVEINALWHHALHCLAELTEDTGEATWLRSLAATVYASFQAAFWDEANQRLRDCLQPGDAAGQWIDTNELRPNQIFAASLEFGPVSLPQRRAIVACVKQHLLTPVGLRTLDPRHPKYQPYFLGDMMGRDGAYHNGTVWAWLIGPYAEAVLRTGEFDAASRAEALAAITPLIQSLSVGCLGSIAEIFDADTQPGYDGHAMDGRRHEGCLAQAWSVAEPLRVLGMIGAA